MHFKTRYTLPVQPRDIGNRRNYSNFTRYSDTSQPADVAAYVVNCQLGWRIHPIPAHSIATPPIRRTQSPTTNRPPTQSNNSESLGFLRRGGQQVLLRHLAQLDVHYNPLGAYSSATTQQENLIK